MDNSHASQQQQPGQDDHLVSEPNHTSASPLGGSDAAVVAFASSSNGAAGAGEAFYRGLAALTGNASGITGFDGTNSTETGITAPGGYMPGIVVWRDIVYTC